MEHLQKKVDTLEQIGVLVKIEERRFYDQNPYPKDRSLWMAHAKELRVKWQQRKNEYICELWNIATGKQPIAV